MDASSQQSALSFDDIADVLVSEQALQILPAELHGMLCGQLAAGARLSSDLWLNLAADLLDLERISHETSKVALVGLYQQTLAEYESEGFELQLMLPDEDATLEQRVVALGCWVQGFLAGFGLQGKQTDSSLGEDARETLNDFAQICQVESEDLEDSDESESHLMELQEYVRMGAIMLFMECSAAAAKPNAAPTVH